MFGLLGVLDSMEACLYSWSNDLRGPLPYENTMYYTKGLMAFLMFKVITVFSFLCSYYTNKVYIKLGRHSISYDTSNTNLFYW